MNSHTHICTVRADNVTVRHTNTHQPPVQAVCSHNTLVCLLLSQQCCSVGDLDVLNNKQHNPYYNPYIVINEALLSYVNLMRGLFTGDFLAVGFPYWASLFIPATNEVAADTHCKLSYCEIHCVNVSLFLPEPQSLLCWFRWVWDLQGPTQDSLLGLYLPAGLWVAGGGGEGCHGDYLVNEYS